MRNPFDGGPAFPRAASEDRTSGDQPDGNDTVPAQAGMSLRDYFAAHATEPDIQEWLKIGGHNSMAWTREEARYQVADSMLRARTIKGAP